MVAGIRHDQAVGDQLRHGGDAGLVGDIARREDERRVLAVQVGEFTLQLDQRVVGAGDVAGAAGPGAHPGRSLDHGADHLGVLAHAEVVVGAPYDDVARAVRRVPDRAGKPPGQPLEIGEYAITSLVPQLVQGISEKGTIIHGHYLPQGTPPGPFRRIKT